MPGPASDSYEGPQDGQRMLPRWAYPNLTDAQYEELCRQMAFCTACRKQRIRHSKGYPRSRCCDAPTEDLIRD